jgi:hypothetical protein
MRFFTHNHWKSVKTTKGNGENHQSLPEHCALNSVRGSHVWTDSNGEAHFDVSPNHGKVFVDGSTEYEGHLSGRIVVYI